MKSKSNAIWIDLSDMLHWRGHFTGIQRVVYNIASRFAYNDGSVRFFHYDQGRDMFLEIDFGVLEDLLKPPAAMPTSGSQSETKSRLKTMAIAQKTIGFTRRGLNRARRLVNGAASTSLQEVPVARFESHDKVLVLGGNWDKPGYVRLMNRQKAEKGFKFAQMYFDLIPVYDQGHVAQEEHTRFGSYIEETLRIADGVFAISKYTKSDLMRFIKDKGLPNRPITVVRLGDDIIDKKSGVKPVDGLRAGKYILSVSTVEVRKNHALLYYSLKLLTSRRITFPKIVIVGKKGWLTDDIRYQFTHDPDLKDKVMFVENASDDELSWMYKNCLFTVYPSFYEGWGLPVAESLLYGKPCLASNSTSIPEVGGDILDYFSPFDSKELANLIEKYVTDEPYVKNKETQIINEYHGQSWDDTYLKVREVIDLL